MNIIGTAREGVCQMPLQPILSWIRVLLAEVRIKRNYGTLFTTREGKMYIREGAHAVLCTTAVSFT